MLIMFDNSVVNIPRRDLVNYFTFDVIDVKNCFKNKTSIPEH